MKTINEEVNRISQLMGVDNTKNVVISEQLTLLRKLGVVEYADDVIKLLDGHVDDLRHANKITHDQAEELKRFINKTKESASIKSAAKNAESLDDIIEKYFVEVGSVGSDAAIAEKRELLKLMNQATSDNKTARDKLVEKIYNDQPNIQSVYDRTVERLLRKIESDPNINSMDDVYKLYRKELDDLWNANEDLLGNITEMKEYFENLIKQNKSVQTAVSKKGGVKTNFWDIPKDDVTELGRLKKFWINFIEPWSRWWKGQINLVIDDIFRKRKDLYQNRFNEAFARGLREFQVTEGGKMSTAYYRDILEKFYKLPRRADLDSSQYSKNLYDELWDKFVKDGQAHFNGDAKQLADFNAFCARIQEFNGGNKTMSLNEVLTQKSKEALPKFDEDVLAAAEAWSDEVKGWFSKENFIGKAMNYFFSGTFSSPAAFTRSVTKDFNKKFAKLGGKASVYTKKQAFKFYLTRMVLSSVVLPAVAAIFESIIEGAFGKATDMKLIDREDWLGDTWYGIIASNIVEDILYQDIKFDDYLRAFLSSKSDVAKFDITGYIPGLGDNLFMAFYNLMQISEEKGDKEFSEIKIVPPLYNEILNSSEYKPFTTGAYTAAGTSAYLNGADMFFNMPVDRGIISNLSDDRYRKYFYYIDKNSNKDNITLYFFMNNPNETKTLKLNRTIKYKEGGQVDKVIYSAEDEMGAKYDHKNIKQFLEKIISYVDSKKLLLPVSKEDLRKIVEEYKNGIKKESITPIVNKILKEMREGKKFGEDNFKHWKDTFKFKKYDEKTNQLKDVKISSKMDEIMDRIDHFRKKYDEDDAFVRAVVDVYGTQIDIIQHTKGLAQLTESFMVEGLMSVLATLRESKELVTWTVKHYKDGNWELVKGNFNKKELLNVGKTKREREERQKDSENPAEGLKKKEQESIMILNRDEKEGLNGLPTKVKQKIKEKLRQGWTTEKPFDFLSDFYTESEINSVFNDKIKIFKLKPSAEFFRSLTKNSAKITIKKGFCKSIKKCKKEDDLNEKERSTLNHFISKCESKFGI